MNWPESSGKWRPRGSQLSQSFAKYSRSDATVAVLDAVETLDELTMDQVDKKRWKQPKKGTVGHADNYSDRAAGDTPVQIGENVVGVRIAVRDMAKQRESQICNWGIKKDTSLGGVRDDSGNRKPYGASSDVSDNNLPQNGQEVNGNTDEIRAQGVDTHRQSIEGGQEQDTGDGHGAVGAAASRFQREVKTSQV